MPFFYEFHLNGAKLKGIEIGFSHSRKWEEALDEAKLSIPFYESEEPVSQYGLMEITITEVEDYTDLDDLTVIATETLEMLVYSDKVSVTSQYDIWRHDINIIEYTAKLDAYIMASLARTRDLENTNLAKFELTDDGIIFNNGGDFDLNAYPSQFAYNQYVWLPPVHIQQNYYTDTNYTIDQVSQAYQANEFVYGYLWSYNRRPTVFRIVNVDTSSTGAWQTLSSGDVTISFTTTGNYYIEYGLDALAFSVGSGYAADEYAVIRFYVKVIDQYKQTMYEVIQSIRQNVSKGGGIESEYYFNSTRIFDIDSSIETYLKSIQVPQMYLENATARQMLIFALSYINALPRLEYGIVLDTLKIEKFNLSTGTFVEENTYTKSGSQNINQIGTRSYSPLNQVLPSNMDEPTTYSPSQDGLQQVRATNLQITDSSFSIKLEKEIYTPKELVVLLPKVSFTNSEVTEFSIPDIENIEIPLIERLINISEWKLKYVTDNFPSTTTKEFYDYDVGLRTNMVDNLYWELGSKKINLSDIYGTLVNKTLFQNVIKLAIYEYFVLNMPEPSTFTYHEGLSDEVEVMVVGGTVVSLYLKFLGNPKEYKDLRFRFSYLSIEDLVTKTDKEDLSQIDFYSEMRQNQDESIINVVRASRKNYGNLQRTGNKSFSFSKIHYSLSEQYEIGKKDVNGYTITQINRQFYGNYFLAEYFVTKHHNRESRQTIVDQTYRWRDNYAKTALKRHEHYSDYVIIYPPTYNNRIEEHTKIHTNSVLFPQLFGILLGEDITDLQTRATAALIRTDGMYEVDTEVSTDKYSILTSVSSYPLKNGLAFTLGFDDNQVAGDGLVERGTNWYNQAVRYTNEQARFTRFGFTIMPKYSLATADYETYPKIEKTTATLLLGGNDVYFWTGSFDDDSAGEDALIVDKDTMTNFNLTYQLSFISYYLGQYILGQKFFDNNWLVNNPNSETVITYLYLYTDGTEYELFDDMFIKDGYDSETQLDNTKIELDTTNGTVEFIGTISLTGVTSWAIGDSDGHLHIACNETLNGFIYNPEHLRSGVKEIGKIKIVILIHETSEILITDTITISQFVFPIVNLTNSITIADTLILIQSTDFVIDLVDTLTISTSINEIMFEMPELDLTSSLTISDTITLTKNLTPIYTASFNGLTGATPSSYSTQEILEGETATVPSPNPTKTGYTFTGWTPSFVALYADQIYTAQWSANSYNVVFNSNGGTGTMSSQSIVFNTSEALTANSFTRTNYTFNNWNTSSDGTGTSYADTASFTMNVLGDTLYAQWTATTEYTITYDDNGGTGGITKDFVYGTYSSVVESNAPTVTRTGYTNTGWTPAWAIVTGNKTYTAQWSLNEYTITYDADGGLGGTTADFDYGTSAATVESNAPTVTRSGFTFTGWTPTWIDVAADKTYTAQWSASQEWVYLGTSGTYDFTVVGTPVAACKLANSSDALAYLEANYPATGRTIGDEARVEIFDTATPIPADCGDYYFDVQAI